jgi:hypothetical protein
VTWTRKLAGFWEDGYYWEVAVMTDLTLEVTVEGAAALGTGFVRALNPRAVEPGSPEPPAPDDTWRFSGGTAWVYRAPGHER